MKFTTFYADKGDAFILSAGGHHVMCDAGMPHTFAEHVAGHVSAVVPAGEALDVVYVSHIDQDHIGGVAKLLDNAFKWALYEKHKQAGDADFKKPSVPRPPPIRAIWHNAFRDLVGSNLGPVRDLLAAQARSLRLVNEPWARRAGATSALLANSVGEAIQVSRRISRAQLGIPLNKPARGKLMMVGQPAGAVTLGGLRITVIGPHEEDVGKLRDEWNKYLTSLKGRKRVAAVRREMDRDEERIRSSYPAVDAELLIAAVKHLGDRGEVSPPNLASLMLLIDEGGKAALLTGDGHTDDVERGLERSGLLSAGRGMHVSLLKVPHHASEHNTTEHFPRRVTADHYVFTGNGANSNPELDVIRAYLRSRLGTTMQRSSNPESSRPFEFWFGCDASLTDPRYRSHMTKVAKLVQDAAAASGGRLKAHYLSGGTQTITI